MLIKPRDRSTEVDDLAAIARRADLSSETKSWVERELRIARLGQRGERAAEHEIEFHFARRPDVATLHGLRLEYDGRSAQIDHLIVTRYLDIWVCESKAFTGRVEINDYGEWQVVYGNKAYGVKSPVLQAWNQLNVLADVLRRGAVPLPKVADRPIGPNFKVAVLFSDQARIARPAPGTRELDEELRAVMKVERLYAALERSLRERSTSSNTVLSCEDLVVFAGKIAALHCSSSTDWLARFGLPPATPADGKSPAARSPDNVVEITTSTCGRCGVRLRAGEVSYCRDRKAEFASGLYCMRCQPDARARVTAHA